MQDAHKVDVTDEFTVEFGTKFDKQQYGVIIKSSFIRTDKLIKMSFPAWSEGANIWKLRKVMKYFEKMNKTEDTYFAFHSYRNDLSRLLDKFNHVIEDTADFWKFVQKYEDVELKKPASSNRKNPSQQKSSGMVWDHEVNVQTFVRTFIFATKCRT